MMEIRELSHDENQISTRFLEPHVTSSIDRRIAKELAVREEQVAAAVALLTQGSNRSS
jgi:hypothetical protein